MRTRQLALTGAAIAVLASLAGGGSVALAAPSCSSGTALALSTGARVFSVTDGKIRRVHGCSTSANNRSYLAAPVVRASTPPCSRSLVRGSPR